MNNKIEKKINNYFIYLCLNNLKLLFIKISYFIILNFSKNNKIKNK